MNKKVLILVLTSRSRSEYIDLENAIRTTWATYQHPNVKLLFYDCDPSINEPKIVNDTLFVPGSEDMGSIALDKTIRAFEYCAIKLFKDIEWDYIFRTNLGSFVSYDNMLDWLKDKPLTEYYSGFSTSENHYASGSGYFISKDLVHQLILHKNDLERNVDDVSIGSLLLSLGYKTSPAIRGGIQEHRDNGTPYIQSGYEELHIDFDNQPYHWRLRSENRDFDIKSMKRLWNELKNKQLK